MPREKIPAPSIGRVRLRCLRGGGLDFVMLGLGFAGSDTITVEADTARRACAAEPDTFEILTAAEGEVTHGTG